MTQKEKMDAAYTVLQEKPAESAGDQAAVRFPAMSAAVGPLRNLDGRRRPARIFHATRRALIEALGGEAELSPQQLLVVRMIAEADALRRAAFADAVAGIHVPVSDFNGLAQVALRGLSAIGLQRRLRDVQSLADLAREADE